MVLETIRAAALALAERSQFAMLGTNGADGYPQIKAMIKIANEGLNVVWFSTNTSSARVGQLQRDGRACVYLVDMTAYEGLALTGTVSVRQDLEARQRCWFEGAERYYPLGLTDPGYCVLQFIAERANYYHGLQNSTFVV